MSSAGRVEVADRRYVSDDAEIRSHDPGDLVEVMAGV